MSNEQDLVDLRELGIAHEFMCCQHRAPRPDKMIDGNKLTGSFVPTQRQFGAHKRLA